MSKRLDNKVDETLTEFKLIETQIMIWGNINKWDDMCSSNKSVFS